jgi:hypothetical protein
VILAGPDFSWRTDPRKLAQLVEHPAALVKQALNVSDKLREHGPGLSASIEEAPCTQVLLDAQSHEFEPGILARKGSRERVILQPAAGEDLSSLLLSCDLVPVSAQRSRALVDIQIGPAARAVVVPVASSMQGPSKSTREGPSRS